MEEKQKSVAMNGITFGMITGGIMILISLILYLLDLHLNKSVTWVGFIALIAGMIWGTLDYRNKVLGGYMSYGKAFVTSFMIALFAGIVSAIYAYLFFQFIAPDAVQAIMEMSRQSAMERSPELSEEQLDQAMQMSAFMMTPVWLSIWGMISNILISAIVALITSIFIKKEDKTLTSTF